MIDVLFVIPNSSKKIYQNLSNNFSAIEPPTWALLLASSMLKNNFSCEILDCDALRLNENEAIVTSMNLISFSQQNNDEMGIHVTKENDADLYNDIYDEVQRLLTISEEIRVSVKKVDKEIEKKSEKTVEKVQENMDLSNSKLLTTKELSQLTGLSSRKVNSWFTDNKLMYKKEEDWITTKKGKELYEFDE